MSNNKLLYEAPMAETLVIRFGGRVLTGSTFGAQKQAGAMFSNSKDTLIDYSDEDDF